MCSTVRFVYRCGCTHNTTCECPDTASTFASLALAITITNANTTDNYPTSRYHLIRQHRRRRRRRRRCQRRRGPKKQFTITLLAEDCDDCARRQLKEAEARKATRQQQQQQQGAQRPAVLLTGLGNSFSPVSSLSLLGGTDIDWASDSGLALSLSLTLLSVPDLLAPTSSSPATLDGSLVDGEGGEGVEEGGVLRERDPNIPG
ncbi:hypothetical protein F4811DRAFT_541659 [Daldinia bambusicola]|nr:hypothetical protein F4811DRAFT_541659 [Daldinia bambusicola]